MVTLLSLSVCVLLECTERKLSHWKIIYEYLYFNSSIEIGNIVTHIFNMNLYHFLLYFRYSTLMAFFSYFFQCSGTRVVSPCVTFSPTLWFGFPISLRVLALVRFTTWQRTSPKVVMRMGIPRMRRIRRCWGEDPLGWPTGPTPGKHNDFDDDSDTCQGHWFICFPFLFY